MTPTLKTNFLTSSHAALVLPAAHRQYISMQFQLKEALMAFNENMTLALPK